MAATAMRVGLKRRWLVATGRDAGGAALRVGVGTSCAGPAAEPTKWRTAATAFGRALSIPLALASSQWDVLRKYSSPDGNGARSIRNDTSGWRFELPRSTSRNTCGESAEFFDKTSTSTLAASIARTMASA